MNHEIEITSYKVTHNKSWNLIFNKLNVKA
jgi:hypothetical protein